MKAMIRAMLRNPVLANILMMIFLFGGIGGISLMIRESFPDFKLDFVTVSVPYPGANPDEVEEGICRPLEDALKGIEDVKRVTTIASEGSGRAMIECVAGADISEVKDEVKARVDAISTFPIDSESPVVQDLSFDEPVLFVTVYGDASETDLKEYARDLETELTNLKGVSRADLGGIRDYQVSIEVSEVRLQQFDLTFAQVAAAVSRSSLNLPGGTIRTEAEDLKIRALGQRYYAKEFSDIVILAKPDGTMVRLSDVADIRDTFDDETEARLLFNGKPAVNIRVLKSSREDAIDISKLVHEYIADRRQELPEQIQIACWLDGARLIKDRINMLLRNGLIGLALVFLILWLFLDLRLSFWVMLGIPISLSGGLAIMAIYGSSINMISMFGMIMVLGIIVDDAIVVGESIYHHRAQGEEGFSAATAGTAEVFLPVLMAVLTTITAFIPLYFVSGVMGKFIAQIPTPVIAALAISLFESLYILPVHLRHLPKTERPLPRWFRYINLMGLIRRAFAWGLQTFVEKIYGPFLDFAMRWRYATIAAFVLFGGVVAALYQIRWIKQDFFPKSDSDFITCQVELPNGVPIDTTEAVCQQITASWYETAATMNAQLTPPEPSIWQRLTGHGADAPAAKPDVTVGILASVGQTMGAGGEQPKFGNNVAEVFIELLPTEQRGEVIIDGKRVDTNRLIDMWREQVGPIVGATSVTFKSMEGGPPGGSIQIDVLGRDQDKLLLAVDEVSSLLAEYPKVYDISSTYQPGKTELRIDLKPTARTMGLTLQDLASQLRQGFFGNEVSRVQRGGEEVKIMVRYTESERHSVAQLENLRIRTPSGDEVPLHMVATIEREAGFATVTRVQGRRQISVTANMPEEEDEQQIMDDLLARHGQRLEQAYGVTIKLGNEVAERKDSMTSMMVGGMFAILVIFLIMASIFRSYIQPLLILFSIPVGVAGAFLAHGGLGLSVSIMSFFGLVALLGVAVNDAIVFIVAVNERVTARMPFFVAVREAGKRRFRAILLTSATTFFGLFPMILETSFQAKFLIPMAVSIAFGVAAATVGTLLLIPCLLGVLNDLRCLTYYLRHLRFPDSRESVEPAANIGHL